MIEVVVDQGMCMGAGECIHTAPELFTLDKQGRARVVLDATLPEELERTIVDAARACPNFAIHVSRTGTPLF